MSRFASFDSGESVWVERQVEAVKQEVLHSEYPQYRARDLIPTNIGKYPYAQTWVYSIYDTVGMFKIITADSDDLPNLDVYAKEYTAKVFHLGAKYGWTTSDVRIAARNNYDLTSQKGLHAKESQLHSENKIAWKGSPEHNIYGLVKHPNTIKVTLPNDGKGGGTSLASKVEDPQKMIRDLTTITMASSTVTNTVEIPDTLILPMSEYVACTNTLYSSERSVLKYFLAENPFIKAVDWIPELKNAGSNSSDVILCYKRDKSKLELVSPMEFTQQRPQEINLKINVPCEFSTAGVIVYKPLSIAYAEVSSAPKSTKKKKTASKKSPEDNPEGNPEGQLVEK